MADRSTKKRELRQSDAMKPVTFDAVYDGGDATVMSVDDLAPALLAIGRLIARANHLSNGDRATVTVSVRAGFEKSSFLITIEVAQTVLDTVRGILGIDDFKDAKDLLEFVIGGGGLIGLIKLLRGSRPAKSERTEDGRIRVESVTGDVTIINAEVLNLYVDPDSRQAAASLTRPLATPGVEKLEFKRSGKLLSRVTEKDLPSFNAPEVEELVPEDLMSDSVIEQAFQIVKPSLERGLTWKLYDGQQKADFYVKDESFLSRVERGEVSFTVGDVLIGKVHRRTFLNANNVMRSVAEIVEVTGIKGRPRQLPLLPPV